MTCIQTGARVRLADYGCVVAADLYRIGNCIVIRMPDDAMKHANRMPGAVFTHEVTNDPRGDTFWRLDIGVIVVPHHQVESA